MLGGILKRIGNFEPDSFKSVFESRLILQKTIYLLQAFDLYLGYQFSWYIRGPYSTQLAHEGYALVDIYEDTPPAKFVEMESEKRFLEFLSFLNDRREDADWLERLASIHFLNLVYPKMSKEDIIKRVMVKQPSLTREKCEEAWNYLKKYKLLVQNES